MNDTDPAITAEWLELTREGGSTRAYVAAPRDPLPTTPSIVLAMHLWGIDAGYRDVARRFAHAGFATIVPDLYARFDVPSGDDATDHRPFVPYAQRLVHAEIDADIRAAAAWLRARLPDTKTAIAGFCMGGRIAMYRTAGYSELFTAAAVWYGLHPDVDPHHVDIPIVASFGGADPGIPVADVEAFRDALRVPNDFAIYANAQHAFCDDRRSAYDRDAAEDSWRRTIAFLAARLGS